MRYKRLVPAIFAPALAIAMALSAAGMAQAKYPDHAITMIIPFNPGGQSDVAARLLIPGLEKQLGVKIVPQYRVGAGGAVGWATLAHAKPDGYTIAVTNLPHIMMQPLMIKNVGYKTWDLAPVYVYATTPGGIAVLKSSKFQTLQELIDYAKSNPKKLTVAGVGFYTGNDLGFLELEQAAGIDLSYVNFSGAAPQTTAILGGQVDAIYGGTFIFSNHADKLRVLAFSSNDRVPQFPNVPTFRQLGLNVFEGIDRTITVPAGTPQSVIQTLASALATVTSDPQFQKKMDNLGFVPLHEGPQQYKQLVQQETAQYVAALEKTGALKPADAKAYMDELKGSLWYQ